MPRVSGFPTSSRAGRGTSRPWRAPAASAPIRSTACFARWPTRVSSRSCFGRTPLSDLLRSGVPDSLRAVALLAGEPWRRVSYDLIDALRGGRSPFERAHGMPLYTYLARRPGALRLFTEVMEEHWPAAVMLWAAGAVALMK